MCEMVNHLSRSLPGRGNSARNKIMKGADAIPDGYITLKKRNKSKTNKILLFSNVECIFWCKVSFAYEAKAINEGSQRICGFQGSPPPGGKAATEARFGPRPLP